MANPGDFCLSIEEARKSGASDPRNETMLKIFSFVNVGERTGSGMGTIENGRVAGGYPAPVYEAVYAIPETDSDTYDWALYSPEDLEASKAVGILRTDGEDPGYLTAVS